MTNSIRRTFVDGKYGQIHCRVAGRLPAQPAKNVKGTIVCLHMSPKSGRSYAELLPHLAEEHIALAPDYPGYGESDAPPPEPHVSVEDYAESVWEVVDQLGKPPIHFVGYHTGSLVAVEAASQRPEQTGCVINISAPLFTDEELKQANHFFAPIPLDEEGTRYTIMWERVMHYRGPGMTLEMAATSFAENLRGGEEYEAGHRAAFAYVPTYRRRIAALDAPILVLNPKDDCYEQTCRVDPLLSNGFRHDLPEWGHGFLQIHPEETARLILDFIGKASGK